MTLFMTLQNKKGTHLSQNFSTELQLRCFLWSWIKASSPFRRGCSLRGCAPFEKVWAPHLRTFLYVCHTEMKTM